MSYPAGNQPHTLAQLARRAGIAESRARALYRTDPSGLPKPDRYDADRKPLWFGPTVDSWSQRTGRAVPEDSLWLFRAPAAAEPAVEMMRRVVTVGGPGARRTMFAIVWDTDRGHVIYLQPLGNTGGDHKDWMASGAAELIEPRWWSTAVVIMPMEEDLAFYTEFAPIAYVYKLVAEPDEGEGPQAVLRRWLRSGAGRPQAAAPRAKAVWQTHLDLGDIAKVIGRPIPFWLRGTATVENAERSLAYASTFTVPDTVTEWPATQARLERAVSARIAEQHPAAFAALAADAADGMETLRTSHEKTPSTGDGWYLVARPARPAPPVELERLLANAVPVRDLDIVAAELAELRSLEADLDVDDPLGDVYEESARALAEQLRAAADGGDSAHAALTDDPVEFYSAPWEGPVVDAWRANLTPADLDQARRLRRVRRLLDNGYEELGIEAFRDAQGRYVVPVRLANGDTWFRAEWPTALDVVGSWTDETVLAADESGSSATLLALTPAPDGKLRTDPVPLLPRSGSEGFGYGYSGGGPAGTYVALLRCALRADRDEAGAIARFGNGADGDGGSQLWEAISGTRGPLRLSWPQVELWARADREHAAQRDNAADRLG
ncbi:hypothetical protein [Amycolatopsis sp. NPDC004079]|uniref:hypothetical protein n=1 Tax=Amycolatopsis sp. NPDC004079 TaxID=3154549 RepID=UPI00339EDDFF